MIKLRNLDEESIVTAAKQKFKGYLFEYDIADLFLKDYEDGEYIADIFDAPFYVSTQYAYEDLLVNGNKTRYKIHISTILLKKEKYEVVYRYDDRYYVVYEEDGEIKFMKYSEFQNFIKPYIHKA